VNLRLEAEAAPGAESELESEPDSDSGAGSGPEPEPPRSMPDRGARIEVQFKDGIYSGTVTAQDFDKMSCQVRFDRDGAAECALDVTLAKHSWRQLPGAEVRKTPSWPRSWANFSVL
jgi:hypothetical protein